MKPKYGVPYMKTPPSDPKLIKAAKSEKNLKKGLAVLDSLWKKGLTPKDTEKYYHLTWFAFENGNMINVGKRVGMHRNSISADLIEKVKVKSRVKLRAVWKQIYFEAVKKSFADKVFEFYKQTLQKPLLTKIESEALTNLWLMGMSRRVVRAHFILWSMRQGRTQKEICRTLGRHNRTIVRFRSNAARIGSPESKWLKPLKLKKIDWIKPGRGKWNARN